MENTNEKKARVMVDENSLPLTEWMQTKITLNSHWVIFFSLCLKGHMHFKNDYSVFLHFLSASFRTAKLGQRMMWSWSNQTLSFGGLCIKQQNSMPCRRCYFNKGSHLVKSLLGLILTFSILVDIRVLISTTPKFNTFSLLLLMPNSSWEWLIHTESKKNPKWALVYI